MDINHFIKNRIKDDLASGKINKVVVRFPPEPNGYLHLGHVKSIVLNSSLAKEFNGEFNLRFDDTNPEKETDEYVNAIKNDAMWMTNNITRVVWASDYFDKLYECAIHLVKKNLAYVDDSTLEDIRSMRGDFNTSGTESPWRNRSIEENLLLLENMKNGMYEDGAKVLRAKIDMSHPNLNMRDPILYRIRHVFHHNTGDKWCIYPMYDYAHPLSDAIEGITHSICTLEFEDHRPLYDWCVENCFDLLGAKPEQIEFARLCMEGILLSKRKLNNLVKEGKVSGWNSPVMPTVSGLRNRGLSAEILREFIVRSGISKANSVIAKAVMDDCIRDLLSPVSERRMAVINPVMVELENWDESRLDVIHMPNHPKNKDMGERELHLGKFLWVEADDIRLEAEKDFWRIYPGNWVRLKHGYNVLIKEIITENGKALKVIAEVDFDSKNPKEAKHKAKAALHWLSAYDCADMNCAFYDTLCDEEGNYLPDALVERNIKVENNVADCMNSHFEFERNGYFYVNEGKVHCLTGLKSSK
jgi:glutaminyl-tRNA synthetase